MLKCHLIEVSGAFSSAFNYNTNQNGHFKSVGFANVPIATLEDRFDFI